MGQERGAEIMYKGQKNSAVKTLKQASYFLPKALPCPGDLARLCARRGQCRSVTWQNEVVPVEEASFSWWILSPTEATRHRGAEACSAKTPRNKSRKRRRHVDRRGKWRWTISLGGSERGLQGRGGSIFWSGPTVPRTLPSLSLSRIRSR